ncbi:MAG: MBL fold metallo-hydrolase [Lachnospiraceae bacterium]|nr:MBL fold metallo-hydrolase [Lachnospiraceae bacterium]
MDFCSIGSGSSGNCIFAGSDQTGVLIDAGLTGKRIREGVEQLGRKPEELAGIVVTHEHIDHVCGLGVLARKYHIPIYATEPTIRRIRQIKSLGKIEESLFRAIRPDEELALGDLRIRPFRISHDAACPVGYRVTDGNNSVAVATDMGCYDEYIVEALSGLDGILLEANHDINMVQVGPYPWPLKQRILGERGHLSNEHCGRLLSEILHDQLKTILLGHLSQDNNYPPLALATVDSEITMADNPYRGDDFPIAVAPRDTCSKCWHF